MSIDSAFAYFRHTLNQPQMSIVGFMTEEGSFSRFEFATLHDYGQSAD